MAEPDTGDPAGGLVPVSRLSMADAYAFIAIADSTGDADAADTEPHRLSAAPLAQGIAASPGVGAGRVCASVDQALDALDHGEPVVLVMRTTSPADEPIMRLCNAIVTVLGSAASHAAVVARAHSLPCVTSVAPTVGVVADRVTLNGQPLVEGEWWAVNGSDGTIHQTDPTMRHANQDAVRSMLGAVMDQAQTDILIDADTVLSNRVEVFASADNAQTAALGLTNGASGIGLCRTEHFFVGDAVAVLRAAMQPAATPERDRAVEAIESLHVARFTALLDAVGDRPVHVRLLDAPTHEFGVQRPESNPMMGLRGVRLGLVRPDIYRAQVLGLWRAAAGHRRCSELRLLIPLVADAAEVDAIVQLIAETIASVPVSAGDAPRVRVGAMIETPRAALTAGRFASMIDFVSFGTNDLTQLCWGLSRDDADADLHREYQRIGAYVRDPFVALDRSGVGALIRFAITELTRRNPDIELSACGEHCGDPQSISVLIDAGVRTISCPPSRVAAAKVAAAKALLGLPNDPEPPGFAGDRVQTGATMIRRPAEPAIGAVDGAASP